MASGQLLVFLGVEESNLNVICLFLALMKKLKNIHPGEILAEEFLAPMNITGYRLAKDIGIAQTRVSEILKGNRGISADTALRLSIYFGNSAKFWLGLQADYDLEEANYNKRAQLHVIKPHRVQTKLSQNINLG